MVYHLFYLPPLNLNLARGTWLVSSLLYLQSPNLHLAVNKSLLDK